MSNRIRIANDLKQTYPADVCDNLLQIATNIAQTHPTDVFARGFLYVNSSLPKFIPPQWVKTECLGGALYRDPRVSLSVSSSGVAQITCLGIIVDIRNPELSAEAIVQNLAETLNGSEASFFESLSWMNGRYVILYKRDAEGVKILECCKFALETLKMDRLVV